MRDGGAPAPSEEAEPADEAPEPAVSLEPDAASARAPAFATPEPEPQGFVVHLEALGAWEVLSPPTV